MKGLPQECKGDAAGTKDRRPSCARPPQTQLDDKGLTRSELRRAPEREGGRRRRYHTLTKAGLERLREARADLIALWRETPLGEGAR